MPDASVPDTATPSATVVVPPALAAAIWDAIVGMHVYLEQSRVKHSGHVTGVVLQ